jgi:hypothetical protein
MYTIRTLTTTLVILLFTGLLSTEVDATWEGSFIGFSNTTASVNEGDTINVTITRSGDADEASVEYGTHGVAAVSSTNGDDRAGFLSAVVNFAKGGTSKAIDLLNPVYVIITFIVLSIHSGMSEIMRQPENLIKKYSVLFRFERRSKNNTDNISLKDERRHKPSILFPAYIGLRWYCCFFILFLILFIITSPIRIR